MSATASATNSSARNKHFTSNGDHIDITKEEFSRISEAFKQEEFRKLFLDYCEEIQDPENRKRYEEEIIQLESERGVEVKFVNPEPGFVIKTSADGAQKCFVNVAKSTVVSKPSNEACLNHDTGKRGLSWAIPLAQAAPRDDVDSKGKRCLVYDVVFHPDALYLAQRNDAFRQCLIDTALDAVEREFKVKLDHANLKFPKMQFKGIARPTVIRKLAKHAPAETAEPHPLESIYPARPTAQSAQPKVIPMKTTTQMHKSNKFEFATPLYIIKHRRNVDLAEYTNELDAKLNVTIPRELVVEIELPLLNSTVECQLDVTPKSLYLLSDRVGAKYRLQLDLPYVVDDKQGSAIFDSDTRKLSVRLPVVQQSSAKQRDMHNTLLQLSREDSGVESEVNSNNESPVEELSDNPEEATIIDSTNAYETADKSDDYNEFNKTENINVAAANTNAFLKDSIHYQLPAKFDCNVLDNVMSLVLQVRNVQSDSIAIRQQDRSVHLQFTSIGSGYYPSYYAFYLQLPTSAEITCGDLVITSAEAEAWENNVVLNVNLSKSCEELHNYLAGINGDNLNEYNIQEKFQMLHNSRQRQSSPTRTTPAHAGVSAALEISVERSDCEQSVEIEIKPRDIQHSSCAANTTEDDEDAATTRADVSQQAQKKPNCKKQKKKNKKRRSYSESACDDLIAYQEQQQQQREKQQQQKRQNATLNSTNAIADIADNEGDDSSSPERLETGTLSKQVTSASMDVPTVNNKGQRQQQALQRKQRSYSECRVDSVLSSSAGSSTLPPSFKGILKRYSRYEPRRSISDSCSSIDEYSSYSCSTDIGVTGLLRFSKSFTDIPEENVNVDLSESCKKTVRFNEVIKKQVFRLDSSILGQRKKNQKRRDRKQRALQRRLSEGDSVDYEDNNNKAVILPTSAQYFKKNNNNNHNEKHNGNSNKKNATHDSGLDLYNVDDNATKKFYHSVNSVGDNNHKTRARLESESSSDVEVCKNVMMFEMDM